MTVRLPVINTPEVKDAMKDLMHHFEENFGYKATVHDEDRFPKTLEAKKETSLRIRKDDRGTFTWIDLVKVNEHQQQEEWNKLLCFADHQKNSKGQTNHRLRKKDLTITEK